MDTMLSVIIRLSVEKINFYFAQQIAQKVTALKFWMAHWVLTEPCAMCAALLWPVNFLFVCVRLLILKLFPAAYNTVACLFTICACDVSAGLLCSLLHTQ
jgi:hypothetical protein